MLSEISQRPIAYDFAYMCNNKTKQMSKQKRNRFTDADKYLVVVRRKMGEEVGKRGKRD